MAYNAFLSYSHAADARLAAALQSGLHRFARPWNRLRALHVFRDETNLSVNPTLWPSIQSALDVSDNFILLASPESAGSAWVGREVAYWLERHSGQRLLIVLTGGRLDWDDAGAIDAAATDALPTPLETALARQEPLYLDLRWARDEPDLSLRNPRFRDAVAELAATLHGRPKDELIGEDLMQYRRGRRLARSAVAALVVLAVAASLAAVFAWAQRNEARAQRAEALQQSRIALARQLAAQSTSLLTRFPDRIELALLLALESTGRYASAEGDDALRSALALMPRTIGPPTQGGRVRDLAFSPDGRFLAIARDDGTGVVLDPATGRVLATLRHDENPGEMTRTPGGGLEWAAPGYGKEVTSIAIAPDGRLAATGSNDGTARVWEIASGRELRRMAHDSGVSTVAFDPAGGRLASGSKDGTLRLWNTESGEELLRVDHEEEVRQVAFSPDGRWLAGIATGGMVTLIDRSGGQRRSWYGGVAGLGLAFSADGRLLAAASGDVAAVWDVVTEERRLRVMHGATADDALSHLEGWIDDVAFSPDGRLLATGGRDGTARTWSLETGQEIMRVQLGAGVEAVAFAPDGGTLLTASFDGTARLWDARSGRERLRAVHGGGADAAVFSPDGGRVASGGMDGSVRVWELARGDEIARMPHAEEVTVVAFTPDGRHILTADEDAVIRVWTPSGEPAGDAVRVPVPRADRLVVSDDGARAAVQWSGRIYLLDATGGGEAKRLDDDRFAGRPALHPRHVAAWDRTGRALVVWSMTDGREIARADAEGAWELAFDRTGDVLAVHRTDDRGDGVLELRRIDDLATPFFSVPLPSSAGFAVAHAGEYVAVEVAEPGAERYDVQRFLDVWSAATGSRVARIAQDGETTLVGFDPSGTWLLAMAAGDVDDNQEARIWDVPSGTPGARLTHQTAVAAVRFAPDSTVLATIAGGAVHLWDIRTGQPLGLVDDGAWIRDVRFSPDGRALLTGDANGDVVLWRWRTADLRAEACSRLHRNLTADEWRLHIGPAPWRATCPDIPAAPGGA